MCDGKAVLVRRFEGQTGDFGALVGGKIFLASATELIGKPRENERLAHDRTHMLVGVAPLTLGFCPAVAPESDAMDFEVVLSGDVFIGFAVGGGEDDLESLFEELGHGTFPMEFLEEFLFGGSEGDGDSCAGHAKKGNEVDDSPANEQRVTIFTVLVKCI